MQKRKIVKNILLWYQENKRDLPWRKQPPDPYAVWISEVMLQQTTVQAVIPYYQRFLKRFPNVDVLRESSIEEVYSYWAGLGYYSRARNILKAAQIIGEKGFPNHLEEFIKLPGFGPYTARAVAAIAFEQPVGVLDGNVARVFARFLALELKLWLPKEKRILQEWLDDLAGKLLHNESKGDFNQALMDLGSTICTPQKPLCSLCPLQQDCLAFKRGAMMAFPLKKQKEKKSQYLMKFKMITNKNRILVWQKHEAPFLKKVPLPPHSVKVVKKTPDHFLFKHFITRFEIFVDLMSETSALTSDLKSDRQPLWLPIEDLKKHIPSSLVIKLLEKERFGK